MSDQQVDKIKREIWQAYLDRTPKSQEHNQLAKGSLPGGDTRSIGFFQPYPFFVARGEGCRLLDVDGNAYIDFVNNMTSLVHGHAHPHVMEAIRRQTEQGITHGLPVEAQYRLAELLCSRIASIDSLRFCNTGSEATMFCMRAARAFTGKETIIKMDGGYHGGHDFVQVNPMPDLATEGLPVSQPTKGVPSCVAGDIRVVPFNDLDAMERVLVQEKGDMIHHFCLLSDSIEGDVEMLKARGVPMADQEPRVGLRGKKIALTTPEALNGITIEISEP